MSDLITFFEKIFPEKSDDKKKQWIKVLLDEEYENTDDLSKSGEEGINSLNLPGMVKEAIKNSLFRSSKEKSQISENLEEEEKKIINSLVEKDFPIEGIIMALRASPNSVKSAKIEQYAKSLIPQPKPIPDNAKLLFVKSTEESLPCYQYVGKKDPLKRYYTFLVIGETGTGKTTLLDAFVNFLTGTPLNQDWRWKLVDENHLQSKKSQESQTTDITYYFVNDERNVAEKFNICIIDTPGLGDTGGVLKDNEIIKKFDQFFKEIGEIDYILLTVKASTTRWTQANSYIYDRVQEIFGIDAKTRFVLMCTFSDGKKPLALETLKGKLIFEEYFQFNNSALHAKSDTADQTTKQFWNLGKNSIERFFDFVQKRNLPPLSLFLSKQVLEYRKWLYQCVQTSQNNIKESFKELDRTQELLELIKVNRKRLDSFGSFTYECDEEYSEMQTLPQPYQWCSICNVLCCQDCVWPAGYRESQCIDFNGGRGCPRCNNCPKFTHKRMGEIFVKKTRKVIKEYDGRRAAFNEEKKNLTASEAAINNRIQKMENLGESILESMQKVRSYLEELDKIALKPRLFTNEDYFIQMIDYEKREKAPGWIIRVEGLEKMLETAKQISMLTKSNDINDLFPQYKEVINHVKNQMPGKKSCNVF